MTDDAGLLERARRGDADAFSQLFARFQGPLFRYAVHMCGHGAADDIVQETFLAVLRQPGRYDSARGTVVNYLFGIARNLALKRLTSREVAGLEPEIEGSLNDSGGGQPTVLDDLTRTETIGAVRSAIRSLPAMYREVVALCELQEMSYESAAAIAECPVGTIRSRLHRARTLLMTKLAASMPAGVRK